VELSKNITLGQYIPGDSAIHRMDPRMKIGLWLVLMVALFFVRAFVGYAIVAAFILAIIRAAKIPIGYALRGLKPAIPFLAVLFVIQLMFSGSLFLHSENVIFEWWFMRITTDAVRSYSLVLCRVVMLFLSVTILTLATSLVSLTDAMERMMAKIPGIPANEVSMVMVIAVRFVPTLVEELERIMKAQMARGADLESGNFIQKTRQRIPVLIPLLLNSFARAEELIVAMEARCYRGGKGRSRRKQLRLATLDWQAAALFGLFITLLFAQQHYLGIRW
jgi:energy-coupling factor transport system permease protein